MDTKSRVLQVLLFTSVVGGILCVVLASVTAVILLGGSVLTWLVPAISMEFASLISGVALLTTGILIAFIAQLIAKIIRNEEIQNQQSTDQDDEDDENDGSDEAAEWLAERIAEMTSAKLRKWDAIEQRSAARSRRK
jgi:hypothetical protein